jgi:hypothetical protein
LLQRLQDVNEILDEEGGSGDTVRNGVRKRLQLHRIRTEEEALRNVLRRRWKPNHQRVQRVQELPEVGVRYQGTKSMIVRSLATPMVPLLHYGWCHL